MALGGGITPHWEQERRGLSQRISDLQKAFVDTYEFGLLGEHMSSARLSELDKQYTIEKAYLDEQVGKDQNRAE